MASRRSLVMTVPDMPTTTHWPIFCSSDIWLRMASLQESFFMVSNGPPFFSSLIHGSGEGAETEDGSQKGNGHFAARKAAASSLPREIRLPAARVYLVHRNARQSRSRPARCRDFVCWPPAFPAYLAFIFYERLARLEKPETEQGVFHRHRFRWLCFRYDGTEAQGVFRAGLHQTIPPSDGE